MLQWIEVDAIIDGSTQKRTINLSSYKDFRPYGVDGSQTMFVENGGSAIVLEGMEIANFIADVPYASLAAQIKLFSAGVDANGVAV